MFFTARILLEPAIVERILPESGSGKDRPKPGQKPAVSRNPDVNESDTNGITIAVIVSMLLAGVCGSFLFVWFWRRKKRQDGEITAPYMGKAREVKVEDCLPRHTILLKDITLQVEMYIFFFNLAMV